MLINGGLIAAQQKLPTFGASFDGTNDYLVRGATPTGLADGKLGIFAIKFRVLGGDGTTQRIVSNADGTTTRFVINRQDLNLIRIFGTNTSGTTNLLIESTATITADGNYHIVLASWDIGTDDNHLYVDGSSGITVTTSDNTNIDYTSNNFGIGADANSGGTKLNADINVLYLNLAEKIDFSSSANRLKFFDATGKWVPSRMDGGQEPTGNRPVVYLPSTYRAFQGNHGSGGGFSVTGALTEPA